MKTIYLYLSKPDTDARDLVLITDGSVPNNKAFAIAELWTDEFINASHYHEPVEVDAAKQIKPDLLEKLEKLDSGGNFNNIPGQEYWFNVLQALEGLAGDDFNVFMVVYSSRVRRIAVYNGLVIASDGYIYNTPKLFPDDLFDLGTD